MKETEWTKEDKELIRLKVGHRAKEKTVRVKTLKLGFRRRYVGFNRKGERNEPGVFGSKFPRKQKKCPSCQLDFMAKCGPTYEQKYCSAGCYRKRFDTPT